MSLVDFTLLLRGREAAEVDVGGSEVGGSHDVGVRVRGGATTPELFPLTWLIWEKESLYADMMIFSI